ncbi:hypothetical protein SK128_005462 [Halocaridina rubra]|uniref:Uncharacterized protein n=1 Tax=Halocaridina rubra TaxID=373956 RepID=A0AAN8XH00_HALRR
MTTFKFPRLKFWSTKKCQACKGQPTPPPCYNCVQNLETPPPTYASVEDQMYWADANLTVLDSFTEEYSDIDDVQLDPYLRHHLDSESSVSSFAYGASATYLPYENTNFEVHSLSHATGSIALGFLPEERQRSRHLTVPTVDNSTRTRHRSSPLRSTEMQHTHLSRIASTPLLSNENPFFPQSDRGSATDASSRSSLSSLIYPPVDHNSMYEEPISPRGISPMPSHGFIPE